MTDLTIDDLNEGQRHAFESIISTIKTGTKSALMANEPEHITVNGPAGTGKTTLTKFLIDHLISKGENGVMLAAPTHQAKKVLSKLSGMDAVTIHSLLKINPTTYEDSTAFEQSDAPDFSECRILICDEVSMYDRELFKILMASVPSWCTIIGLGDIAQIRPVAPGSSRPELSAFFFNKKFKQVSLTEVMRSNAPIIEVATEIRNGGWIRENIIDGHGVHDLSEVGKSVSNFMSKYFSIVKDADMLFDNRMLAYTNKSVDNLNKVIRQRLYDTQAPFIKHEVLVMQEPLIKTYSMNGKSFSEILFNNGELVRILDCVETTVPLFIKGIDAKEQIKVWHLQVQGVDSPVIAELQVIYDERQQNIFQFYMAKAAEEFKSSKTGPRPNWKGWWKLKGQFQKVKALPCGTIHKSQGSTVDSSFLFTACIHKADPDLAQQLLYVAATRAKNDVYFI